MDDLTIGSANGPAYEKSESRSGPPLDYVAEKLRSSLESLRRGYHSTNGQELDGAGESLRAGIYVGFKYELTAFLALHNMLNLANDRSLTDRLLSKNDDQYEAWMDRVEAEGSVTG